MLCFCCGLVGVTMASVGNDMSVNMVIAAKEKP